MSIEINERIRRIPIYPAAAGYALSPEVASLASNETPDPPLPQVMEAIARVLPTLNRYPDPSCTKLREALSRRYDVAPSRIAIGNGSCELLLAMGAAVLEPGAELIYAWPSFSMYPQVAAVAGATAVEVPLEDDHHDLDAMAAELTAATRMVIVCNPNNPTSTALPLAEITAFLERVPSHVAVFLDEAYIEYNLLEDPDASLELLPRFPNLVLLRTFSKVYGLCGLRVGYGLCGADELRQVMDQVRQPFSVNAAAQAAATEALRHQDAVAQRVEEAVASRLQIDQGLRALALDPVESQANFTWFRVGDAEPEIVTGLRERDVLVRSGTALGQPGFIRVSYGTPAENARFLEALGRLL